MKLRFLVFCILAGTFVWPHFAVAADPPKKSGFELWQEADKTRNDVRKLRKTDPQAAAKLLEDALDKVTDANVAADFFTTLGEIYTLDLKKPDEALKVYERALPMFQKSETKVPAYHWMTMVANKINALVAVKKFDDATKLLNDNQALMDAAVNDDNPYSRYAAHLILQSQISQLEAQDKGAETTALLTQFVLANPRYLTVSGTPGDWADGGWPLHELIERLKKAKRLDEAMSWGKLMYRLSAFDKKEIENATRFLNSLWAEQENFPAIAQLNKAQTDAAIPNPLVKVAVPTIPAAMRENFKKRIADMEGRQVLEFGPSKARDIINLRLIMGTPDDLREAMSQAYLLLKKRPDLQDGSLQICRIFKAADGNLIRANNFLSYLEGNGENPIPAFLDEMQKKSSGNS